MAGAGLLMLLDDITALLDDVALMAKTAAGKSTAILDDVALQTKVAMQKTAGVLGDDLALNAEQVTGVSANRELPVVWAVAKGSLINKAALVPAALLISAFASWLITPLLMIGGAFLCYEGMEKILHLFHKTQAQKIDAIVVNAGEAALEGVAPSSLRAAREKQMNPQEYEQQKVKGAIRTDFILSAEIMAIALGTVATKPIWEQAIVLVAVALAITVFVYGLVAGIVRMDDVGGWLMSKSGHLAKVAGRWLIAFTPWLMRGLSVVGTAAMFMVGGSLLVHGITPVEQWIQITLIPLGGIVAALGAVLVHVAVGAVIGVVVLVCVNCWQLFRSEKSFTKQHH